MKILSKSIAFVATMLMFFSCSNTDFTENVTPTSEGSSLTATQERLTEDGEVFGQTRTTLGDKNVINWTVGDAINLWDGTSNLKFVASKVSGTTCTFTGHTEEEKVSPSLAFYPYDMKHVKSDNKITGVTLPCNQNAVTGSFDPACNLMVASASAGGNLEFKHVCSYIKVVPMFACSRIVFTFTDAQVAGTFDVEMDADGTPKVSNISAASSTITLLGDMEADKAYYIAVLPGTYDKGFKVELEPKPTKKMVNTKTKTINVSARHIETTATLVGNRAKIKSLGAFDESNTIEDAALSIPYEDMGYGDDLSATTGRKVLWAKINLGADLEAKNETDKGAFYAWGEVKPKSSYTSANYLCSDYYPEKLDLAHDAAAVNWGHGWRMPTVEDFKELKENCIFVCNVDHNNVTGLLVYRGGVTTGGVEVKNYQMMSGSVRRYEEEGCPAKYEPITEQTVIDYISALSPDKDAYLFMPFAGNASVTSLGAADAARYWMNSHGNGPLYSQNSEVNLTAYYWGIDGSAFNSMSYYRARHEGLSIRPVFELKW